MRGANRLRLAPLWWTAGIVLALLIVFHSLTPAIQVTAAFGDKIGHALGYAALSFWFAGLVERRRYVLLGAVLLAFGIAMELAQHLMGLGRTADWGDVAANLAGILAALGLAYAGLGAWMIEVERRLGLSS